MICMVTQYFISDLYETGRNKFDKKSLETMILRSDLS